MKIGLRLAFHPPRRLVRGLPEVPGSKKKKKSRVLTKVMVLIERGINYDSKNDEKPMKTYAKPSLLSKPLIFFFFFASGDFSQGSQGSPMSYHAVTKY